MSEEQVTTVEEVLTAAGIPTQDQLMGLIMSIESNGMDEARMEKAFDDWTRYYTGNDTNFGWVLCHLICKADINNLHRLSKGFPEHIRIWAEKQILANADEDKLTEVMSKTEEEYEQAAAAAIEQEEPVVLKEE